MGVNYFTAGLAQGLGQGANTAMQYQMARKLAEQAVKNQLYATNEAAKAAERRKYAELGGVELPKEFEASAMPQDPTAFRRGLEWISGKMAGNERLAPIMQKLSPQPEPEAAPSPDIFDFQKQGMVPPAAEAKPMSYREREAQLELENQIAGLSDPRILEAAKARARAMGDIETEQAIDRFQKMMPLEVERAKQLMALQGRGGGGGGGGGGANPAEIERQKEAYSAAMESIYPFISDPNTSREERVKALNDYRERALSVSPYDAPIINAVYSRGMQVIDSAPETPSFYGGTLKPAASTVGSWLLGTLKSGGGTGAGPMPGFGEGPLGWMGLGDRGMPAPNQAKKKPIAAGAKMK